MKEAQKIIEDTINMIDEYQAKIEAVNQKEKVKLMHIVAIGVIVVTFVVILTICCLSA